MIFAFSGVLESAQGVVIGTHEDNNHPLCCGCFGSCSLCVVVVPLRKPSTVYAHRNNEHSDVHHVRPEDGASMLGRSAESVHH
jgi:hypothetical protein